MIPPIEELKQKIEAAVSGAALTVEGNALIVPADKLTAVGQFVRDDDTLRLDFLSNVTAADYPPERIEVIYHLFSMMHKHGPVVMKVKLPRENTRVASLVPLWRSAEFQEREVYDLYGVAFDGHPDLRRILMWDEFEGFPMRKDYKHEDQDVLDEQTR